MKTLAVLALFLTISAQAEVKTMTCSNADASLTRTEAVRWSENLVVFNIHGEIYSEDLLEILVDDQHPKTSLEKMGPKGLLKWETEITAQKVTIRKKDKTAFITPGGKKLREITDWIICREKASPVRG